MCKNLKEWTFLLYANGSNELEPETWQSVVEIQSLSTHMDIQVVVQVSREKQDVISFLRPNKPVTAPTEEWSGVRRYVFDDQNLASIHQLTNVTMADPTTLCDFICWGIEHFPAKRYMLSLSGHIYQFVGMCPDYSGAVPMMMGFPALSASIQSALMLRDTVLDVLILDTCYASTVELLYELGRYDLPRIKRVLTYIGKGPLSGLPYANLLSLLEPITSAPTDYILNCFVDKIAIYHDLYGLIALAIAHEPLELARQLFDRLAASYLLCKDAFGVELTPEELLANYRKDYPWSHYLIPIHKLLKGMILAARFAKHGDNTILPIHILYQKIPDEQRKNLYSRLAFSKENHWANLLCDFWNEDVYAAPIPLSTPIPIEKNILTAFIYAGNENLSMDTIHKMTEDLIQKKDWKFI